MPQVIPIAIAGIASWGGSAFLGTALGTAMTGAIGAVATGAIAGAVIGAGLGALSAAVMGGDIGKGALYGAVGGAIGGGLAGFNVGAGGDTGAFLTDAQAGASVKDVTTGYAGDLMLGGTKEVITGATAEGGKGIVGMLGGPEGILKGGLEMGGGLLMGMDESEEAQKDRDWRAEQAELDRMHQKELTSMQTGGGGRPDHSLEIAKIQQQTAREQLAEERRQYDTQLEEGRAQRKTASSALAQARAANKAGKATGPSIDQQVAEQEAQLMANTYDPVAAMEEAA